MMHRNALLTAASALLLTGFSYGQVDSGSDGTDGALNIAGGQGNITMMKGGLDGDGDGIYNFTSIEIGAGTTALFTKEEFGPDGLIFLCSGDVTIEGELDVSGFDALSLTQDPAGTPAPGGPGGFDGGTNTASGSGALATSGEGPGGGGRSTSGSSAGGHGGYGTSGTDGFVNPDSGGATYGNGLIQPLIGGSGGGGRSFVTNLGLAQGGGGGGAILIAADGTVTIDGAILAEGGSGSAGGSGGAIRIVATQIEGDGTLSADGGASGGDGRIRLEADSNLFAGSLVPVAQQSFPRPILFPNNGPVVRLVTVDGVAVAADPTGSFAMPDVTINNDQAVTLGIEAENIPLGTTLNLRLVGGEGADIDATSTPLAGDVANSTATATMTIPAGFSRFYLSASW